MKRFLCCFAAFILILCFCAPELEAVALEDGTMEIQTRQEGRGSLWLLHRSYAFSNGTSVTMSRAKSTGGEAEAYAWQAEGAEGVIRFFDGSGQWIEQPLAEGDYRAGTIEVTLADTTYILYPPKTYLAKGYGTLEYLPGYDGCLRAVQEGGGWRFTLLINGPAARCFSDFTVVRATAPLLPWIHEHCPDTWQNYTQDGEGKWCFDGYYRTSPTTYAPTGEDFIYRCPASYVVRSLAQAGAENQTADALSLAMLETLTQNQTETGFWPTEPESLWLSGSYQVGPGFYDTRFNTDLMEIYVILYQRHGGEVFRQAMERYVNFYAAFAEDHHTETAQGGWLVEDYWTPSGSEPLHTSLNHQLAECLVLYHLSDALEREDLRQLAQRLLTAVEDTAPKWIRKDRNLHYRVQPSGRYGGGDYPYLTYNDLYDLQAYLTQDGGQASEALATLMASKRQWMDSNGITEYKK